MLQAEQSVVKHRSNRRERTDLRPCHERPNDEQTLPSPAGNVKRSRNSEALERWNSPDRSYGYDHRPDFRYARVSVPWAGI